VLIGVGVSVVVVVLMRAWQGKQTPSPPRPARKLPPRRTEGRPDTNKRLSALKRRVTAAARNGRDK
jgi:hypothetical protein